jgi:hypothetical protein
MKTVTFLTAILLSTATLFAQDIAENEVPSVVLNNFKKEFPKASDVEWERHGEQYNVEFEIGWFNDYEAWFSASGELLKHTEEISEKDLPQAVKETIKNQYADYSIDDAVKITENNTIYFMVEIEKGNEEKDLHFSAEGDLIKK